MEKQALNVEAREGKGKGVARSLRRQGRIPAVIYGQGESTPVSINRKEITRLISSGAAASTLFTVSLAGKGEKMALIKDYQLDPITSELLHADLMEVSMSKAVHVTVPVALVGAPAGAKEGGLLEHLGREIEIECMPSDIPAHIDVDITGMKVGETVHVSDLKLPKGVKALTEAVRVIVTIAAPITAAKLEQALAAPTAGESKEPEVLTKPKKEEA
jgi:large subunit ribosomal protein L25